MASLHEERLHSAAPDIRDKLTSLAPNKPRLGHLIGMCSKIESLMLLSIVRQTHCS